jgi:hypothetical protein
LTLTIDHVVVGAADLAQGRAWARRHLGVEPSTGGRHVFMGTHNEVLRFDDAERECYLEILAIDPEAPDPGRPRWFDLDDPAIQAALTVGPRLLAWVARSDDLDADRARLLAAGCDPGAIHAASRDTPTCTLRWRITIPADGRRRAGGAVPTLIAWDTPSPVVALPASGVRLERIVAGGVPLAAREICRGPGVEVTMTAEPLLQAVLTGHRGRTVLAGL